MRDPSTRFAKYLRRWWTIQHEDSQYLETWRRGRDEDQLASGFRRDAAFEIAQARFLLRRPNEESARALVEQLEPVPTPEDADLLVRAIVRAGATAQKVRATTAIGAVVTVSALVVRNVLRGR